MKTVSIYEYKKGLWGIFNDKIDKLYVHSTIIEDDKILYKMAYLNTVTNSQIYPKSIPHKQLFLTKEELINSLK